MASDILSYNVATKLLQSSYNYFYIRLVFYHHIVSNTSVCGEPAPFGHRQTRADPSVTGNPNADADAEL